MKKLLIIAMIANALNSSAQLSGTVTYEEKVKLNIQIDDTDANSELMKNIPRERTSSKLLVFNPDASMYKKNPAAKAPADVTSEHGDAHVMIKVDEPDDCSYSDLKEKKIYDQRDFMSRQFLIESDFDAQVWKLTGNEKKILDYPCQEAQLQDTAKKVTAWFTSAIPVSIGPNGYANLPGLILRVEVNGGDQVMAATKVDLGPVKTSDLVKPKQGKKVTKAEFRKIVADKQKEMQDENGGGNNVIIRIKN